MKVTHAKTPTSVSHFDIIPAGEVMSRHRIVRTQEPEVRPEFGSLPMEVSFVRRCTIHGVQVMDDRYDSSHASSVFCPMGNGHWTNSWFVCKVPLGGK